MHDYKFYFMDLQVVYIQYTKGSDFDNTPQIDNRTPKEECQNQSLYDMKLRD